MITNVMMYPCFDCADSLYLQSLCNPRYLDILCSLHGQEWAGVIEY